MLRHDDITVDAKLEAAAHTLQRGLENLPGDGCGERGTAMVAAERHQVSLPGRVESFQSPGHKASVRLRIAPLKPKDGMSGPPENGDTRVDRFAPARPPSPPHFSFPNLGTCSAAFHFLLDLIPSLTILYEHNDYL